MRPRSRKTFTFHYFCQGRIQEPPFADISTAGGEAKGNPGDHKEAGCQVKAGALIIGSTIIILKIKISPLPMLLKVVSAESVHPEFHKSNS